MTPGASNGDGAVATSDVRVPAEGSAQSAGRRMRALRVRTGLTTRKVADFSRRIALCVGRADCELSHARLVQIENGESAPSIYKLFSLSVIYGATMTSLLSLYIDLDLAAKCHLDLGSLTTVPIEAESVASDQTLELPVAFNTAASLSQTTFISELVSLWGNVPTALLAQLNLRRYRYAVIGLADYTMYPLLRPGSFVRIEKPRKWNHRNSYANEYQRPIYFIEHRAGYICSWCEFHGNRIVSIPHPLSPCSTQVFVFPDEAEIVGVVTAIAVPLTPAESAAPQPGV